LSPDIHGLNSVALTGMTIESPGNAFTGFELDVFKPATEGTTTTITVTLCSPQHCGVKTASTTIIGDASQNFEQITTIGKELISSIVITPTTSFQRLRKYEIIGIQTAPPLVPEPSSSSMLLLGGGALIFTQVLRRKLL
jgi:hypothetical protein